MAANTCITCGKPIPKGAFYCTRDTPRSAEFELLNPILGRKSEIVRLFDPTARVSPCFAQYQTAGRIW